MPRSPFTTNLPDPLPASNLYVFHSAYSRHSDGLDKWIGLRLECEEEGVVGKWRQAADCGF